MADERVHKLEMNYASTEEAPVAARSALHTSMEFLSQFKEGEERAVAVIGIAIAAGEMVNTQKVDARGAVIEAVPDWAEELAGAAEGLQFLADRAREADPSAHDAEVIN